MCFENVVHFVAACVFFDMIYVWRVRPAFVHLIIITLISILFPCSGTVFFSPLFDIFTTYTHTFSTLLRCWSLLLLQTILFQLMWVAREMKDRIINFGDSTTTCRRLRSRPQRDRPVAVAVERLVLVVVVQEGLMSQATTIMPPPQPPIAGAVALEPAKSAIQTSSPPHRRPRP